MTTTAESLSNAELIERTQQFVQATLAKDCSGHDWWHIQRVWRLARTISEQE